MLAIHKAQNHSYSIHFTAFVDSMHDNPAHLTIAIYAATHYYMLLKHVHLHFIEYYSLCGI